MQIKNAFPSYANYAAQRLNEQVPAHHAVLQTARDLSDSFLNKLQPLQAQEFLVRHIAKRLSQASASNFTVSTPGNSGKAINELVQHGEQLQRQGMPAQEVRQTLANAQQEGFDLLQGSGQLSQRAHDLLNNFNASLQDAVNHSELARSSMQQHAVSFSQTTSIQLQTREGDTVTIDLSHASSQTASQFSHQSNSSQLQAYEITQQSEDSLRIHVEGNLNSDEQQAIEKLLHKLDGVADKFHAGNDQGALASVSQLTMGDELASFSVQLHSEASQRQVQAVETFSPTASTGQNELQADIDAVIQQARQQTVLAQDSLHEDIKQLMHSMLQLKHPSEAERDMLALNRLFSNQEAAPAFS